MRIAVLLALSLTACATPQSRTVVKEVLVPVPVKCVSDIPPEQDYEGKTVKPDDDVFEVARKAAIERRQRKVVEERLRAALAGCGG